MRNEPNASELPQSQQRQILPLIQQKLKGVFLLPFYRYRVNELIRQSKTPKELYKILAIIDRSAKESEPRKEQYLEQQAFEQRVKKELAQGMEEIAKERGYPEIFTALEFAFFK